MNPILALLLLLLAGWSLAACGAGEVVSPVTPHQDRLTFLFFFTDN